MILVRVWFNTDHDGTPVPESVAEDDMPTAYYGPFADMGAAEHFMNEVWPDGDTDVHEMTADTYGEAPCDPEHINHPSILGATT